MVVGSSPTVGVLLTMVGRQPAEFLMQMRPLFGKEEKEALASYMDEDGFLTEFRNTTKFENAIAEFTGAKHCVVTNNGRGVALCSGVSFIAIAAWIWKRMLNKVDIICPRSSAGVVEHFPSMSSST